MQIPSGVTVEVGISRAMFTAGPSNQTATIVINACFFVERRFVKYCKRKYLTILTDMIAPQMKSARDRSP